VVSSVPPPSDAAAWAAAFARFADALNAPRDRAALSAAVVDDVELVRFRPGERAAATRAEAFAGVDAVARWFARTPGDVRFSLVGAPWREPAAGDALEETAGARGGEAWGIEYAIDAGEFHNGGVWIARRADDGRLCSLAHHPFALREA